MLAFRTKVRRVLLAASTVGPRLASVVGAVPPRPAVYLNHISFVQKVNYPAVSLYWTGGTDRSVQFARRGRLQVDIWAPVHIPANVEVGAATGLTGANELYEAVRTLLHLQHRTGSLHDAAYQLHYCVETDSSYQEDFDETEKLVHIGSEYLVVVSPAAAEMSIPT